MTKYSSINKMLWRCYFNFQIVRCFPTPLILHTQNLPKTLNTLHRTLLTSNCYILSGTLCEGLLTLPSFTSDMAYVLSWESPCYCQSVHIGSSLSIDQRLRQGVDVVIRELYLIPCPGDVGWRAVCGSASENKCWAIH